jgi:hypothetical protein
MREDGHISRAGRQVRETVVAVFVCRIVPVIEDMDCAKLSVEHASNTKNEKIFFMA